jgi:hypothetical protein
MLLSQQRNISELMFLDPKSRNICELTEEHMRGGADGRRAVGRGAAGQSGAGSDDRRAAEARWGRVGVGRGVAGRARPG